MPLNATDAPARMDGHSAILSSAPAFSTAERRAHRRMPVLRVDTTKYVRKRFINQESVQQGVEPMRRKISRRKN